MNICFNGCSLTEGQGFPIDQRDLYIYDRLLEKQFLFERTNIAQGGSSNYTIFMRSAESILSGNYNCVVTQWSALNRIWFYPGPDSQFFVNDRSSIDFVYRDIRISAKEKEKFKNTLLLLNGDYHNIIELVKFTKILETLAESNGIKLVFINGLVPWTDDLIQPLGSNFDQSLSAYTKDILDFDNRKDNEILDFFTQLQKQFQMLNQSLWVNLFHSFHHNTQDLGPEGHHPGINSHQWMATETSKFFIQNNII